MSVPTNTALTYDAVGNREDLSDELTMISPVDTLFYNSLGVAKADAIKQEWVTDALSAAGSNSQLEGDDTTPEAIVARTRLYNMQQIQKKSFVISGSQEAVDKAGIESEIDHQTAKKLKELAKDTEYAFLREVRADGAAGTARKMRGALNWVVSNLDKASDATLNADGTVTGGTARALTSILLGNVMQSVWSSGGDPKVIYSGGFQKRTISGFQQSGNYRQVIEDKTLNTAIDVYVTDFGVLAIKPHRLMPTDVVFVCDEEYWKKATLRPTFKEQLGLSGDNRKFQILQEHTLKSMAEAASGRITNLTTS